MHGNRERTPRDAVLHHQGPRAVECQVGRAGKAVYNAVLDVESPPCVEEYPDAGASLVVNCQTPKDDYVVDSGVDVDAVSRKYGYTRVDARRRYQGHGLADCHRAVTR